MRVFHRLRWTQRLWQCPEPFHSWWLIVILVVNCTYVEIIMHPLPAALKDIAPYLQRANEVDKVDPVVAYWCMLRS